MNQLDNFIEAFSTGTSGCRRLCDCGRVFYDAVNSGFYDWEDGEFEELEESDATGLPHACGDLRIDGREYVDGCDCWHQRARQIMAWLDANGYQAARYLTLERQRKMLEAEQAPVVKDPP